MIARASAPAGAPRAISERAVLFALAGVQFCHLLDFVIMMPLGPQFMRVFAVGSAGFGALVSSYAVSAGVAGLIGSFFLDRFDRKRALLGLLAGFSLATLACGLAPGYGALLAARILTGAFGGVLGAQILAAVGDLFPPERRGMATGVVFSSFAVASVAGVPIGLYFASHFGWRWPFIAIAVMGLVLFLFSARALPPMHAVRHETPRRFWAGPATVLGYGNAWIAFAFLLFVVMGSFSVIPYIAPYLVANVGLREDQLPFIYLAGGGATFFTSRIIGHLADRFGKRRVFLVLATIATVPVLAVTNLPHLPLAYVLGVTTVFFVFVSGRFVPAMAMITGSVPAASRGSFMALVSAVQQFSVGIASLVGGLIVQEAADGRLSRYPLVGVLGVASTAVSLFLATRMRSAEVGSL